MPLVHPSPASEASCIFSESVRVCFCSERVTTPIRMLARSSLAQSDPSTSSARDDGGLGVLVDQENTVVTVTGQPGLQVGDKIVGIDGDPLSGRPVGQCLKPGEPQYTFAILRPSKVPMPKINLLCAEKKSGAQEEVLSIHTVASHPATVNRPRRPSRSSECSYSW